MTDRDREKILKYCSQTQEDRIVITHGTDTMTITGEYIAKANLNKTIVITGAMIPYSLGFSSDGMFNLGTSVAFAQSLQSGVYISMNGQYFEWNEVKKNKSTGYFERIEN
jgi:L-asparaginase